MDVFDLYAKISLDTSGYDAGLQDASIRHCRRQKFAQKSSRCTEFVSLPDSDRIIPSE